jgi:hypothetical protein
LSPPSLAGSFPTASDTPAVQVLKVKPSEYEYAQLTEGKMSPAFLFNVRFCFIPMI